MTLYYQVNDTRVEVVPVQVMPATSSGRGFSTGAYVICKTPNGFNLKCHPEQVVREVEPGRFSALGTDEIQRVIDNNVAS